jgi:hypothetical protein
VTNVAQSPCLLSPVQDSRIAYVSFDGADKRIVDGNIVGGDLAKPVKQRVVLVYLDEKRCKICASLTLFPIYLDEIQEHLPENSLFVHELTVDGLEVLMAMSSFLSVCRDMETAQGPSEPLNDDKLLLFKLSLDARP